MIHHPKLELELDYVAAIRIEGLLNPDFQKMNEYKVKLD